MDAQKVIKTGQEQAVAAWIDYLNQVRFTDLISKLNAQDGNLQDALDSMRSSLETIRSGVIEANRGGERGMHGFIAEVAEVRIGNARRAILGEDRIYDWINDNGPDDIRIGDVLYQMKFVEGGGSFSLNAVAEHLDKYPDYLKEGHKYIIPKDFYEKVKALLEIDESEAAKLSNSGDGPSLRQWRRVHEFFDSHDVTMDDLEPSQLEYDEVQQRTITQTMQKEEESLREQDERIRKDAYEESKPTLGQAVQVTITSAAIEGATAFALAVTEKIRSGKSLRDFTEDDWREIAGKSGTGTLKGGIRGASIYALTNFTATPGAVASSLCTASFGIAEQAHKFRRNEIDEVEFIRSSEIVCLDAAVSALSSAVGQAIIPIPVIGAVIGNTVGTIIYQTAKDGLSSYEQKILDGYAEEQRKLDEALDAQYRSLLEDLRVDMAEYMTLLANAFHPDIQTALEGSVELALSLGLPSEEILDTKEKIDDYFLS